MRVCVTGGSGFIGTRLIGALLNAGHSASIYDLKVSSRYPELTVKGDVRDADALSRAVAGHDAVVHLAAEHRDDIRPVSLYEDVNVGGARQLVRALNASGCRRVVFTSSVAVYPLNAGRPDESFSPAPFNPYGTSKWNAEQILGEWLASHPDNSLVTIRPCVVFGEGNRGNVYRLLRQIAHRRFLMVGNGNNRKSMAYVGNVAEFLVCCLSLPAGFHLFNYADKPDLAVHEIVEIVRSELSMPVKLKFRLPYFGGLVAGYAFDVLSRLTGRTFTLSSIRIRKFCADTTVDTARLQSVVGFNPTLRLPAALSRTVRSEFTLAESRGKNFKSGEG